MEVMSWAAVVAGKSVAKGKAKEPPKAPPLPSPDAPQGAAPKHCEVAGEKKKHSKQEAGENRGGEKHGRKKGNKYHQKQRKQEVDPELATAEDAAVTTKVGKGKQGNLPKLQVAETPVLEVIGNVSGATTSRDGQESTKVTAKKGGKKKIESPKLDSLDKSTNKGLDVKKDESTTTQSKDSATATSTANRNCSKNRNKKNKAAPVTTPSGSASNSAQEPTEAAVQSAIGPRPKSTTGTKKNPFVGAAKFNIANPSVQADVKDQGSSSSTTAPVIDDASAAPTKKNNKHGGKNRNKGKSAEQASVEPGVGQPVAEKISPEVLAPIAASYIATIAKEVLAPAFETAFLPDKGRNPEKAQSSVDMHASSQTANKKNEPGPKNSGSAQSTSTIGEPGISGNSSTTLSSSDDSYLSDRKWIKKLNLPGISYDKFGICIAPDSPDWVRGRIVRRLQCIISDSKVYPGIDKVSLDIAHELELEKKEKAFFGETTWNTLFKIEAREPSTQHEMLALQVKLREFQEKLDAGLIPGGSPEVPITVVGGKYATKKATKQRSASKLPVQKSVGYDIAPYPHPVFSTSQPSVLQKMDLPSPQMPIKDMVPGFATAGPFDQNLVPQNTGPSQEQGSHTLEYKDKPCQFYPKGTFHFGSNCRYSHHRPY